MTRANISDIARANSNLAVEELRFLGFNRTMIIRILPVTPRTNKNGKKILSINK
jgi:hypothetical protein